MRRFSAVLAAFACAAGALASAPSARAASAPPNLRLSATPGLVDVGQNVIFVLSASSWPGSASVRLTFVSPHHGFTGSMQWVPQCSCFEAGVHLAPRIHPIEQGRAAATVTIAKQRYTVYTAFSVRGLASNGRSLAPGGPPSLRAWVTDPTPTAGETQNFCAWITTADGLGVAGVHVSFTAHYPNGTRRWDAGATPTTGLVCSRKTVPTAAAGHTVRVDVVAGALTSSTSFSARS